jgi:class 3 adenylate cyclase
MTDLKEIISPTILNLVVALSDLTSFARFSNNIKTENLFNFMSEYYELAGDIIEKSGGIVIKFIYDSILIAYDGECSDKAVLGLIKLKESCDKWLQDRDINSRHIIKAHFGSVVCGKIGTKDDKRLDIFGETVNTAELLKSNGFAITPQLFRTLNGKTRKLFKKHTPPITYIPIGERHKD